MAAIDILKKSYEQIKLYPLFFFNAVEEWDYSTRQTVYYWAPEAVYVSDKQPGILIIYDLNLSRLTQRMLNM